jgi:hypothetical protein
LAPSCRALWKDSDRSDIRRWLATDPFRHCGITTLAEAVRHPSCLVLDTQHRFGPDVMRLANLLAYDGLLKAGDNIRAHDASDPEIVLVDTDGLRELAQVRRVTRSSGWWAAGLLLSRALVELHHENGETTGVVTPYAAQAEATLEVLRDASCSPTSTPRSSASRPAAVPAKASKWTSVARPTAVGTGAATTRPARTAAEATRHGRVQ